MSTAHLLAHLQNSEPSVPLPTLLAALSHHLSVDSPTPATLAAAAITSPLFLTQPETHERLQGLMGAFRHAVHLKHQALIKAEKDWSITRTIFSKSVHRGLKEWVHEALKGVQGGRAVLRLASCVGLLLGTKLVIGVHVDVEKVEDEIVIALAEVMDAYAHSNRASEWEREFQSREYGVPLTVALILASQSIPLLPVVKLKALPLPFLAYLLTSTICSTFHDGTLLSSSEQTMSAGLIHIPATSPLAQRIKAISSSPAATSIAGLSKLTAVVLGTLIDSTSGSLLEAAETLDAFKQIAANVEQDWKESLLSNVSKEDEIAPDTRELSRSIWLLLKTLLFSTIMVADGVLASAVFVRPQHRDSAVNPQTLAQSTLQTLFHISFVVSQLGGVTATATGSDQGFKELRRVFYLAIDVLSSESSSDGARHDVSKVCEDFVTDLVSEIKGSSANTGKTPGTEHVLDQAKTAYALACMEQLVPRLGTRCLQDQVWGVCILYLTDSSHRETFESAHSVVLAIFASHAQQQQTSHPLRLPETSNRLEANHNLTLSTELSGRLRGARDYQLPESSATSSANPEDGQATFVQQTIPFYAQCLIKNSADDKLSTAQLRLAYAALVRAASASAATFGTIPDGSFSLAWYCIEELLDMIRQLTATERGTEINNNILNEAQLHRLHLTLISTVASLPLLLMIRALEEICSIITARNQSGGGVSGVDDGEEAEKTKELIDALFTEIIEGVGDREKESAMRWWYANRQKLGRRYNITSTEGKGVEKVGVADQYSGVISRL